MDIASLGIKITTQGAKEASADLDKLDASAKRVEGSVKKVAPAARTSSEALQLFNKIDPAAGKLAALDDLEASLSKLSKAGKVGAEDFAVMSAKLAENRAKILGEKAALDETATLLQKFTNNTRLMSEASTIASDVVSGQFGRIRRSAAAMANASGVFRLAFSGTGAVVLGVAAAVGGLALAFEKAQRETEDFNKAIILTGGYAGKTADDLRAMAEEVGHETNATTGKASEVLAQVAASGQFTAEQMRMVSKAALLMQQATGRSIEETVKDFASLKRDPVEAILKLNEAIGDGTNVTHFLKRETIDQIEKLKDQGKESDATRVAMQALFDAIDQRAPAAAQQLTTLGDLTHNLSTLASHAGDAFVEMFRSADSGFKALLNSGFGHFALRPLLPLSEDFGQEKPKAFNPKVGKDFQNVTGGGDTIVDSDREREILRFKDEYLDKALRKEKALEELERNRAHYTQAEYESLKKGIEERYKPTKGRNSGIEPAEARQAVKAFEDELKVELGAIANQTQVLQANYAARNITATQYYAEQRRLLQEGTTDQEKALQGEIAALQARNVKGKVSIENATQIKEKEAELAKVRADGAAALKTLNIQEDAENKQRKLALLGPLATAEDAHARALREIDDLTQKGTLSADEHAKALDREGKAYRADVDAAKRTEDPMAAMLDDMRFELSLLGKTNAERETAIQLRELERQGIKGNTEELLRQNQAYEGQRKAIELMDQFRQGATDALTEFVTGAKSAKQALKDFFNQLAQEITHAIAQHWMDQLFGQQGQSGGGNYGGLLQGIFSLFSGGGEGFFPSFATGGYTGAGGMYEPAGVVHKGEVVWNQYDVARAGGPAAVEAMRHGAKNEAPPPVGPTVVNQTVVVQGRMDSRTPDQIGQATARAQNRASARNR